MSDGVRCQDCAGTGRVRRWPDTLDPDAPMVRCPMCFGTGTITEADANPKSRDAEIRRHQARKANRDATEDQAATVSSLERWLNAKAKAKPEAKATPPEASHSYHPRECSCTACNSKRRARTERTAKSRDTNDALRAGNTGRGQPPPVRGAVPTRGRRWRGRRSLRLRLALGVVVVVAVLGTIVASTVSVDDIGTDLVADIGEWYQDVKTHDQLPPPMAAIPVPTATPRPTPTVVAPTLRPTAQYVPTIRPTLTPVHRYVGGSPLDSEAIEAWIVVFTNQMRMFARLPDFIHDPAISDIAREHSENMVDADIFSHDISGEGPTDRALNAGYDCKAWNAAGTSYTFGLSENIAQRPKVLQWRGNGRGWRPITHDADSKAMARGLVQQWMDSPGHRRNILGADSRRIGVGVSIEESAEYGYRNETVWATQNFSSCR